MNFEHASSVMMFVCFGNIIWWMLDSCLIVFVDFMIYFKQEGNTVPEVAKREKDRLKEMQRLKKQKIQDILDAQNAAIDADMVGIVMRLL